MIRAQLLLIVLAGAALSLANPPAISAAEVVHYQCKEWKAKHIHDTDKAKTIAETLKKLKCEVQSSGHDGHIDLKYRCEKERQLPVKTHEEAVKWEKWFKEYGFKVYHTH
ncbi:hypothetical protein FYK55_18015 [Roseiconus nitratireducens]|uniref:Uncharacterized protein n=1 Tax=Roseiconus nitratireducens TaxID=2605748 RepID=A0A5M6D6L5_9BACT|nr:hypothetical protein [Roseiconus nitratireducens]KAA5541459.1 hypothetical protein FYK55_18015 [Roseiconus nitratireducens]